MVDTTGWSEMKKLKHRMLKRAFDENRGGEMILLIQWRLALTRHLAGKDAETLQKFEERNAGQPRALRALNLIQEMNGSKTFYRDADAITAPAPKHPVSMAELMQKLEEQPLETRILYRDARPDLARMPAIHADHYDPMEGVRVTSAYEMALRDTRESQETPSSENYIPEAYASPKFMH